MKTVRLAAAIMFVTTLFGGSVYAAETASRPVLIDQALQAAMVPEMLAATVQEQQERAAHDPRMTSLSPEQREKLTQVMNAAFDKNALYEDMAQFLSERFDAAEFNVYIEAQSTPMAKKINAMGVASYKPGRTEALQNYAANLENNPPTKERIQMLARLDDLTRGSEIVANMSITMMSRFANITPADPRYEEMQAKILESSRQNVLLNGLYSLQQASDGEVGQYVALHEAPPVAHVSALISEALVKSMEQSLTRVMTGIVSITAQGNATLNRIPVTANTAVPAKPVTDTK